MMCSNKKKMILLLIIVSFVSFLFKHKYFIYYEDCSEYWIPINMTKLRKLWNEKIYGQPIGYDIIPNAILGHYYNGNSKKALVLSFHGWPGTGKNYVVKQIIESIYKKGQESLYYVYFNSRIDFPDDKLIEEYKQILFDKIYNKLQICEKSVFVFDEVDMMPYKLLDIIHLFIDYNYNINGVNPTKSIFIFLSNRGGTDISDKYLELWKQGLTRDDLQPIHFMEFSNLIRNAAFNEKGGLQHSDNINRHLVSYFVPFLPLEKSHIIDCILSEFNSINKLSNEHLINYVLSQIVFTPKYSLSSGLFSTAGCKNIDIYVRTAIERDQYNKRKQNKEQ